MSRDQARERRRPVVVVGFDAMDIDLIRRWASEGHLPNFARLLGAAATARLTTSSAVLQGSVWNTIATGCSPGKHGSYYMMQIRSGHYAVARIRADHCFREPFWAQVDGGLRAVIVDVPKSAPTESINGLQILEWGAYDQYWQYSVVPHDRTPSILERFGEHPLLTTPKSPRTLRAYRQWRELLLRGVRMKHRLNMDLLGSEEASVFFSVFGETHPCGHFFWRHLDTRHPQHDPEVPETIRNTLRDVYAEVDRTVGELVHRFAEDRNILLVSGHGITADYNPHYLLPELLSRMEMTLEPLPTPKSRTSEPVNVKQLLLRQLRNSIPAPVRRLLNRYLPIPQEVRDRMMAQNAVAGIDFRRSRAFCLPSDLQGFIRVNLVGREPNGVVHPGEEYVAVCDEIEKALRELRRPGSDRPVVAEVFRTRDLYAGTDRVDELPDLCVLWDTSEPTPSVESPRFGTLKGEPKLPERSGNHRPEGFLFAVGPDIETSARVDGGDVLDLAPTIFRLMGLKVPHHWDGRPLEEIFRTGS